VFLGEDNSVKLGDFGLSKMIQSHDFASTYVGTPFYMSPEICAAEKYTLKSDIWSLGCIIYELCTREPPFNAKSHFQLVQKIKEGKVAPLPTVYSAELMGVIKDCLKVNPDRRPDTVTLLNLPVVRLMRKEKEVVDFSKVLKAKEEALSKRLRDLDQKLSAVDTDKAYLRQEIDSSLRREWEVKARLEIDRLVNHEIESLRKKFDHEVRLRVDAELQGQKKTVTFSPSAEEPEELSSSLTKSDYPHSSVGAVSADDDFPSTTDLTELSLDSPDTSADGLKKTARTPFARAQTMFAGTPMDVEMGSPSPIAIASLALSPRRGAATKAPTSHHSNIFSVPPSAAGEERWDAPRGAHIGPLDSDSDEEAPMPSPTRQIKSSKNPFTSKQRPALHAQKSAPLQRLATKRTMGLALTPDLQGPRQAASNGALQERCTSPNRRLSKIPSAAGLPQGTDSNGSDGGSGGQPALTRQPSLTKKDLEPAAQAPPSGKAGAAAAKNNNIKGRTLVELQQARAGGRPLSTVLPGGAGDINVSPKRAFRDHAAAAHRGEPAAVWDPERDEMPSPFLVRRKPVARV
jgi:NIMA (never in mitosis gene a)-related kinase